MDVQQQRLQFLRLHLLDMSKLSQRAVDYATKGYRLGSPEFCRYVRRGDRQLGELRRNIADLCEKLTSHELTPNAESLPPLSTSEPGAGREARFPLSALQICTALHAICVASSEIAHHTMLLLEDVDWVPGCIALEKACYLTNRLMCLCIVALFKKESRHVETVLQDQKTGHLFEQVFHELRTDVPQQKTILAALELAIANSLRQITTQTQQVAEAIAFWLEGTRCTLKSGAAAH